MRPMTLLLGSLLTVSALLHVGTLRAARFPAPGVPPKPAGEPAFGAGLAAPRIADAAPVVPGPVPAPKELDDLREEVRRLRHDLEAERRQAAGRREPPAVALDPAGESILATRIDARFAGRGLLEILEILRAECGLKILYDPQLEPRLKRIRITMDMANAAARDVLDFAGELSGFRVEYFNGWVWIRDRGDQR